MDQIPKLHKEHVLRRLEIVWQNFMIQAILIKSTKRIMYKNDRVY